MKMILQTIDHKEFYFIIRDDNDKILFYEKAAEGFNNLGKRAEEILDCRIKQGDTKFTQHELTILFEKC